MVNGVHLITSMLMRWCDMLRLTGVTLSGVTENVDEGCDQSILGGKIHQQLHQEFLQ